MTNCSLAYKAWLPRVEKNGFGVYYYANGEKYEGEWLNDLKNGLGKMFYFNKQVMHC